MISKSVNTKQNKKVEKASTAQRSSKTTKVDKKITKVKSSAVVLLSNKSSRRIGLW